MPRNTQEAKQVEHGGRVIAGEILACTPMLLISKPDRIGTRDNWLAQFWLSVKD
jgi:hypothetical protein